jgi:NAD(P)-dependent dehydrogenase (short-subunit alcohol dehydrogenase family)
VDLDLNGKIAVVTGASKGIGLAVTRALVTEGVIVVAGARSPGPDLPALVDGRQQAGEIDLRPDDTIRTKFHTRVNDGVRPDLHRGMQLRLGRNDGRRMNHAGAG